MIPEFCQAVDPIFLYVLELLERIARNENPAPDDERVRIRGWIDRAESLLGQGKGWQLAKYALAGWIDEVLINAPWEGRRWWKENALEVEVFNTRSRHERFYIKAKEASSLTEKDALETFYVCVVLGFRGVYRDPAKAAAEAGRLGLPADLEAWAKQAAMAIRLGQGRPHIPTADEPVQGAAPLDGPFMLIWSLFVAMVLSAVTGIVASLLLPGLLS